MTYQSAHEEVHFVNRSGWLRAAVLGANDGIVSISALIVGVAVANPSAEAVFIAGAAGLAAGAMSMAAGEYVSVSSQSDIEGADIAREAQALRGAAEVLLTVGRLEDLQQVEVELLGFRMNHIHRLRVQNITVFNAVARLGLGFTSVPEPA